MKLGHWFWERTNEQLVKIQLFHSAIRKELDDLEEFANSLVIIQREALSFDWPDDAAFNERKDQSMSIEKMGGDDKVEDDGEGEGKKVTATPTNDDKEEDPQHK